MVYRSGEAVQDRFVCLEARSSLTAIFGTQSWCNRMGNQTNAKHSQALAIRLFDLRQLWLKRTKRSEGSQKEASDEPLGWTVKRTKIQFRGYIDWTDSSDSLDQSATIQGPCDDRALAQVECFGHTLRVWNTDEEKIWLIFCFFCHEADKIYVFIDHINNDTRTTACILAQWSFVASSSIDQSDWYHAHWYTFLHKK